MPVAGREAVLGGVAVGRDTLGREVLGRVEAPEDGRLTDGERPAEGRE